MFAFQPLVFQVVVFKYLLCSPRKLGKISNLRIVLRWVETTNQFSRVYLGLLNIVKVMGFGDPSGHTELRIFLPWALNPAVKQSSGNLENDQKLMEEIPDNHLGCIKPYKSWGYLPYQLVSRISEPSAVSLLNYLRSRNLSEQKVWLGNVRFECTVEMVHLFFAQLGNMLSKHGELLAKKLLGYL